MGELFRFWQRLPRLAFGFASLLILASAILGPDTISRIRAGFEDVKLQETSAIISGVFAIVVFMAAGAIGIFLLEILSGGFGVLARLLLRVKWLHSAIGRLDLEEVFLPVDHLVTRIYKNERDRVLEFLRLRSESFPGHKKNPVALRKYYAEVGEHLDKIDDSSMMVGFAYYTSLTQDQAKFEQWEFTVKDLYYFLLFLCLLVVFGIRMGASPTVISLLVVVLISSLLLSLPAMRTRKRRLAALFLISYCDNFTHGEPAAIEDRGEL